MQDALSQFLFTLEPTNLLSLTSFWFCLLVCCWRRAQQLLEPWQPWKNSLAAAESVAPEGINLDGCGNELVFDIEAFHGMSFRPHTNCSWSISGQCRKRILSDYLISAQAHCKLLQAFEAFSRRKISQIEVHIIIHYIWIWDNMGKYGIGIVFIG